MPDTTNSGAQGARKSVLYQRDKKTKWSVLFADRTADRVITVGGLLVIAAVFTIGIFLVAVAAPLLSSGEVRSQTTYALGDTSKTYISTRVDEYKTVALDFATDGSLSAFHVATGTKLAAPQFSLPEGARISAFTRTLGGNDIALGLADGRVILGRAALTVAIVPASAMPDGLTELGNGDLTDGTSVWRPIPGRQFRQVSYELKLEEPLQISPDGAEIRHIDYRIGGTQERPTRTFVTVDATGKLRMSFAFSRLNFMTGETATDITSTELDATAAVSDIKRVLLNAQGDRVIVAESTGLVRRYDLRDRNAARLAETVRVVPEGVQLTAVTYMNGETSLVIGGSDGSVNVWFPVERRDGTTADGLVLTQVHVLEAQSAPIDQISVSQRTRLFVTSDTAGGILVRHGTTARTLLSLENTPDQRLQTVVLTPKDDGVVAIGANHQASVWQIHVPHPETTLQSLFGKVWYEGYTEPVYVWQSTAAQDFVEPKLSLIPLIFGTLKAAIYSMLFALPIALLAAIYTSEFLHYRVRAVVKPVMELMATLPSVVIGFVAALLLSPIVENWVAAVIIAFGVIPLTLVGSAFLWQILPNDLRIRLEGVPRFLFHFVSIAVAVWICVELGPWIEAALFGGDFKKWTSGAGEAQPFVFLMMVPVSFLVVFLASGQFFGTGWRMYLRTQSNTTAGVIELGRWALLSAAAIALAWIASLVLSGIGYDPRGGFVDTYVQRNTLIAAFAIGFAEIPIIYTIAEDALNAVPEHLRAASLGCGATRWQTARWVILPTAGSGIFSAIMIGLGRAVGETMIVVMSTGNTPVLDINIFNGLRALSANINVELPEAVRDSTLYRTLFLCGLTLFVMTFFLNTIAEVVRQRFRKRAAAL